MDQKQKHFDICRKFPVLCTNKCGVRDIPREKLEVHVRDECPATEIQCEYKNLGCEAVFPRSDATSHSQTQIESHLNLALRGLEATQHQVHELVTVVKDQSQQIERQSQQIERQSAKIERLLSKDKEQSEKMERLMSTVQGQPPQRERCKPINQIFPTPFKWKIPNIKAVCKKATSQQQKLVSEPFYLFGENYKYLLTIVVRIYPLRSYMLNPEIDDDLCVYIKVVPGQFDAWLSWPCQEKVRVTLVHQDLLPNNPKNISRVIDFGKVSRNPPIDDGHLILELSRDQLPSYTKDDTIFIRVNRE